MTREQFHSKALVSSTSQEQKATQGEQKRVRYCGRTMSRAGYKEGLRNAPLAGKGQELTAHQSDACPGTGHVVLSFLRFVPRSTRAEDPN